MLSHKSLSDNNEGNGTGKNILILLSCLFSTLESCRYIFFFTLNLYIAIINLRHLALTKFEYLCLLLNTLKWSFPEHSTMMQNFLEKITCSYWCPISSKGSVCIRFLNMYLLIGMKNHVKLGLIQLNHVNLWLIQLNLVKLELMQLNHVKLGLIQLNHAKL